MLVESTMKEAKTLPCPFMVPDTHLLPSDTSTLPKAPGCKISCFALILFDKKVLSKFVIFNAVLKPANVATPVPPFSIGNTPVTFAASTPKL